MYKKHFKRILDCLLASIILLLMWPLLLIIAIAIKLDSKGPALFKQIRTGKNGKEFTLYKFRSMTVNNNFYDTTEEDQVTKVGKFIRKTSLDELPQIFNILKGEMSFIGPRPWIVDYEKFFTKHQRKRLEVLPGITGLAQCSGRNCLNIKDRINIDVEYVNNLCLRLDIYVIFKTIKCVVKREGFSNSKSAIHEELKILKKQHENKKKDSGIKIVYKPSHKEKKIKVTNKNTISTINGEKSNNMYWGEVKHNEKRLGINNNTSVQC